MPSGFPVDSLDSSAFQVVIAAVEGLAHLAAPLEIAGKQLVDERVGCATGLRAELFQLCLDLGREVHFHRVSSIGWPLHRVKKCLPIRVACLDG
jgi:hypothetical protein